MPESPPSLFRVLIDGSLEEVWNEITRRDAPIASFFNSQMHVGEMEPGSRIAMRTPDGKYSVVVGEIFEVVPLKRFSHGFKFTNYDDPECRVTYDLEEVGDKVQFTLTIDDLPTGTKTAKQMVQGGKMIVNTLKSVIETGRPSFGTRLLYFIFGLMAPFTPAKCKSEHWPVGDEGGGS